MLAIIFTLFILYTLLFLYSLKIRDNSIVDVFWGFWFMIIAVLSFFFGWMMDIPQITVTLLILLWGIRLTSHIVFRKLREWKEDPRYAKWREEWGSGWYFMVRSFLQVYILQMFLMFVVSVPILIVNFSDHTSLSYSFFSMLDIWMLALIQDPRELIFLILWFLIALFGLSFETIADLQLKTFLQIKKPRQIFMTGLYRYSRHPNYFGESMFWLWISFISLPYSYIGIIGWIAITCLLLFVSGVPLQEARYEGRPEWEEYKKKTSVFVPWFVKRR